MRNYTKSYIGKFKNEHEKLYDTIMEAPHKEVKEKGKIVNYNSVSKLHDKGLAPALAKLDVKDDDVFNTYLPALGVLTDAFIAYKKKADIHAGEGDAGRSREVGELEKIINSYRQHKKLQTDEDFVKHLKLQGPAAVMSELLSIYKHGDLNIFAKNRIRAALPSGKGTDFYHALAHVHGKNNNWKYSKEKMARLSTHEALTENVVHDFSEGLSDDVLPDPDAIKDTTGKSK